MAFDSPADSTVLNSRGTKPAYRPVDIKSDPGGERGAFTDGVMRVLTPQMDFGTMVGRSAGGIINLLHGTAQHQAYKAVSNAEPVANRPHQGFRNATLKRFETIADQFWYAACCISTPVQMLESYKTMFQHLNPYWQTMPLLEGTQQRMAMDFWLASVEAAKNSHTVNPMVRAIRNNIGGLDNALGDPRISRIITDCADWRTGARRIVSSQDEAGVPTGEHWEEFVATACIPLAIPPLHGIWIDGVFQSEGDMLKGTPVETSRNALLHIDLGRPDYKAYGEAFYLNADLATRAAEAHGAAPAQLPTDRPTAKIRFPDQEERRGVAALPTLTRVGDLRKMGIEAATAALPQVLHDLELAPKRTVTVFGARVEAPVAASLT